MSRKDYRLLAEALKKSTPLASDGKAAMITWEMACQHIRDALAADNPRFNGARFIDACEGR